MMCRDKKKVPIFAQSMWANISNALPWSTPTGIFDKTTKKDNNRNSIKLL